MEREKFDEFIAPVIAMYRDGRVRGAAFFDDPADHTDVVVGSIDLSESEVGLAVYKVIKGRGFSVERICAAVVLLERSEQQRN